MSLPSDHRPHETPNLDGTDTVQNKRFAVALGLNSTPGTPSRVIATGADDLADRIIELAQESGIEIRQDADLVTVLGELELDTVIPVDLYQTIAQILTYVYKMNADQRDQQDTPSQSDETSDQEGCL